MKKIYFAPTAKVVELKAQAILAGSDPQIDSSATEGAGGWGEAQSLRDLDFDEEED